MAILIHQNVLFLVMTEADYLQSHLLCLLLIEPGWGKEACLVTGFFPLFFRPCQNTRCQNGYISLPHTPAGSRDNEGV